MTASQELQGQTRNMALLIDSDNPLVHGTVSIDVLVGQHTARTTAPCNPIGCCWSHRK